MPALPGNAQVADQFDLLADLLELEGADSFRVIAYRRAARRMRETSASIAQLALDGNAKKLQGIGKTIEEKIVEIVETGDIAALAKKRAGVPPEVVLFMQLPGLGPKTAARIWKELGVETLADLKAAAEGERLRALAGLGAKSEEKILASLAFAGRRRRRPVTGALLGDGCRAGAGGRRRACGVAGGDLCLGGRLGTAAQRDVPRPRHHRHAQPSPPS